MWYDQHIEHDPASPYPIRVIEMRPPEVYDVTPRPADRVRIVMEVDDEEARRTQWYMDSAATPVAFRTVPEYANEAIMTTWRTLIAFFDEQRQEYVRMGHYEMRRGWFWSRAIWPIPDPPAELVQQLEAYDPIKAEREAWQSGMDCGFESGR